VGSELVSRIIEKGQTVKAATRNPSTLRSRNTVEAVDFDFDRPQTFAPALKGVEKVFLMARPADNNSDEAARPFIEEAKNQGVKLIVNLTAMGVEQDERFMLRILERYVETSGIPFVHLRPNWFMQNFDSGPIYADIRSTGAIHLPAGEGKLSFIEVRDIAAVAAVALTDPRHEGKAYTLTGSEALTHYDVAEKLSFVADRKIAYIPLSRETARAGLVAAGTPVDHIERWDAFFTKVRQGLCAPISGQIESLLHRPAILFDQYATDHAQSWQ
jgi:uncharacterized protein YbjT (DUF2867 family)